VATETFARGPLTGTVAVPGDKSISHRALIFGALAPGTSRIAGLNPGADVRATRDAVAAFGAAVRDEPGGTVSVTGGALHDPSDVVDAHNSGTTVRLLMGACAGHGITASFDGDASLRRRPMERVARYLRALGATVETTDGRLPARVAGIVLPPGGTFELEVASAQVKSAILLATLRAREVVRITGDDFSRDHTERMLVHFGRSVEFDGHTILMRPGELHAADVTVPGDLSAAAFFLVAAATTPGSDVTVTGVGVNATRTGVLDALAAMGANVTLDNPRDCGGEPVADVRARYGPLRATDLDGDLIVRAIDEIPVLAVAAAHAAGTTHIRGAAELRAKESDRISTVCAMLRACGASVVESDDGLDVTGGALRPAAAPLASHDDHRIAMSAAVLAAACGPLDVAGAECAAVSFPGFSAVWRGSQARRQ
jgi:3-phosphoshikimate 1-carboxyvinyltransferase